MSKDGNDVFDIDIKSGKNIFDFMIPGSNGYDKLCEFEADAIIHTAAMPRIQHSIANPLTTFTASRAIRIVSACDWGLLQVFRGFCCQQAAALPVWS